MGLWEKVGQSKRDQVCWGGTGQVRVLNGVVWVGFTEQVRLRQRLEGGEGGLAEWASGGREPWTEKTRAKALRQSGQDDGKGHRKRSRADEDRGNRGQMGYEAKPENKRQSKARSLNILVGDSGKPSELELVLV